MKNYLLDALKIRLQSFFHIKVSFFIVRTPLTFFKGGRGGGEGDEILITSLRGVESENYGTGEGLLKRVAGTFPI